jgi:predicted aldo/keto reductase-like oxidoreductase
MEPVRGGRLVNLPEEDLEQLNALRPGVTSVEWAFRFLQSMDCVTMTLSGMSNMQQLEENLATFSAPAPLNKQENEALLEIADRMIQRNAVPCTGCNYCVEHCPQGLNIPQIIKLYNDRQSATAVRPESPGPADCVGCGLCKAQCPQNIEIPQIMADYAKHLQ